MPTHHGRTPLGIFLKKMRVDHNENMEKMAKRIKTSAIYLSMIETGKRLIPKDLQMRIVNAYELPFEKELELTNAINQSNNARRTLSATKLLDEIDDLVHDGHIIFKRGEQSTDWYIGYCEALETLETKIRNGEFIC